MSKNKAKDSSLVGILRSWLRGNHNSIRYRFVTRPREYLEYGLFRLTGRSWIDFYANRLDRAASRSGKELVRQRYVDAGKDQFEIIKKYGLKPTTRFLDYGCGVLRTGVHVIGFVQPKHFVGVEISRDRLEQGLEFVANAGIQPDRFETFIVKDCELRELGDRQFDFVWAWSVINHMPTGDVVAMLKAMRRHIAPGGHFIFMYDEGEGEHRIGIKDFKITRDGLRRRCEEAGYRFEVLPDNVVPPCYLARLTLPA